MRNYNSDFLGDCCESELGLPKKCVTPKELASALEIKADKVNTVNKIVYDAQIASFIAIITSLESRLSALENP